MYLSIKYRDILNLYFKKGSVFMGIINDLQFKRDALKLYRDTKISLKEDIVRFAKEMVKEKKVVVKLKTWKLSGVRDEDFFKGWMPSYIQKLDNNPQALDEAIREHETACIRWSRDREKTEKTLATVRPNIKQDCKERFDIRCNFAQQVLDIDPQNKLDLRFHATSLAATKDIIESGGLMSSVDRLDGYIETTNLSNEISVSDINNIQYSIDFWSDLEADKRSLPAGCMFVLQPQSQEEADMIAGRQMHNVYFHNHPEQLVAIITTTENLPQLQQWLSQNDLNPDVACTYSAFPQILENKKEQLLPPYDKNLLTTFLENQKLENSQNDLAGEILDGETFIIPDDNKEYDEDISL